MLHDQQRIPVGYHLLSLIFQWKVRTNFLFVFGIFEIFLSIAKKLFGAAFDEMLNERYHSFKFHKFKLHTTCKKKTAMLWFTEQIAHQWMKKSTSLRKIKLGNSQCGIDQMTSECFSKANLAIQLIFWVWNIFYWYKTFWQLLHFYKDINRQLRPQFTILFITWLRKDLRIMDKAHFTKSYKASSV